MHHIDPTGNHGVMWHNPSTRIMPVEHNMSVYCVIKGLRIWNVFLTENKMEIFKN